MEDNIKVLLLKIIKFNGDVDPLLKIGYEYSQITKFIKDEIDAANAEYRNGTLTITEKGNFLIEQIVKKRKDSSKWIEPEVESKIDAISKDFIFLPNQNDLDF
jgi:hypothetical protein